MVRRENASPDFQFKHKKERGKQIDAKFGTPRKFACIFGLCAVLF